MLAIRGRVPKRGDMILWTQKAANEKISGLEAELRTASADLTAANDARTTAETRVGELEREASEHAAQLQSRDERITALETELATAKANEMTEAAVETKAVALVTAEQPPSAVQKVIAQRVTEAMAAAGAALPIETVEDDKATKTATRADFDAMTHDQRNAFIREGGKVKG